MKWKKIKNQSQNTIQILNEQMEISNQLRITLDEDLIQLNQDKIQLKEEVREWQIKYEHLEKEVKDLLDQEQKKTS